jgi:hypothetical protein
MRSQNCLNPTSIGYLAAQNQYNTTRFFLLSFLLIKQTKEEKKKPRQPTRIIILIALVQLSDWNILLWVVHLEHSREYSLEHYGSY